MSLYCTAPYIVLLWNWLKGHSGYSDQMGLFLKYIFLANSQVCHTSPVSSSSLLARLKMIRLLIFLVGFEDQWKSTPSPSPSVLADDTVAD